MWGRGIFRLLIKRDLGKLSIIRVKHHMSDNKEVARLSSALGFSSFSTITMEYREKPFNGQQA